MNLITLILALLYASIILFLWLGNIFATTPSEKKKIQNLSLIIAARNEEKNLPTLLQKLSELNYPLQNFEIIIANDRSEDNTLQILQNWQKKIPNLKVIDLKKENENLVGKKQAIQCAIDQARYQILVFTDADCLPPKDWLHQINNHFEDKTDFVAGYSPLLGKPNFLYKLKNLERSSIFAVTAGSFFWNWGITCTARNLAYRKNLFQKINGFDNIGHIRSGDDDLLLLKMRSYIRKMRFMFTKSSAVAAKDNSEKQAQINLESRRASKFKYYPADIKLLALLVFLFYLVFSISFILLLIGKFSATAFLAILIIKIVPEFLLLLTFLLRQKKMKLMWLFPLAELLYIPYFIFFAIKGTWGKYRWKN